MEVRGACLFRFQGYDHSLTTPFAKAGTAGRGEALPLSRKFRIGGVEGAPCLGFRTAVGHFHEKEVGFRRNPGRIFVKIFLMKSGKFS